MKKLFEMNIEELENLIADCEQEIGFRKEKEIDELIQKFENTFQAMENAGVTVIINFDETDALKGYSFLNIHNIEYEY